MTCIVALAEKNVVYMAGDSAGVAGLNITIRDDSKVFANGPFIMGFTTSFRMGQLLRFKFSPPVQKDNDDYKYMVTHFIDEARKCFQDNGYKDGRTGGSFLVGYKGKLYDIDDDFQVGIDNAGYSAVGCGANIALGSLFSTKGKAPKERLKIALEAASKFSAGVAPPFRYVNNK